MLYRNKTMKCYLRSTEVIDYDNPDVLAKAKELSKDADDILLIAKRCFEWVGNIHDGADRVVIQNQGDCAAVIEIY